MIRDTHDLQSKTLGAYPLLPFAPAPTLAMPLIQVCIDHRERRWHVCATGEAQSKKLTSEDEILEQPTLCHSLRASPPPAVVMSAQASFEDFPKPPARGMFPPGPSPAADGSAPSAAAGALVAMRSRESFAP